MIGAIGSRRLADVIVFEVSDHRLLTIQDFSRSSSVRFAKHDVLLRKPVSQYIGPDLEKLSFKIVLKAQFGVNPKTEFDKLIYLQRAGEVVSILLGKSTFGVYRWRIDSLGIPYDIIDNRGICMSSTVDISFEEYV